MKSTLIIAISSLVLGLSPANPGEAPSFTLKKFGGAETVKLEDLAGQIVVLYPAGEPGIDGSAGII